MPVLLTDALGVTIETVYWIDFRYQSVGVGLRRGGDDAWAAVISIASVTAVWVNGEGALTADERADCLRSLAGAVYE